MENVHIVSYLYSKNLKSHSNAVGKHVRHNKLFHSHTSRLGVDGKAGFARFKRGQKLVLKIIQLQR